MRKHLGLVLCAAVCCWPAIAADDVAGAVEGTVKKIDSGTKTVVVKTADGSERTFHYASHAAVHGAKATEEGSKDALHGLKEGSRVAVHYTSKAGRETADEFDDIGKDGLKATEGSVKKIDRGAKTVTVKTADGAEETYHMAAHGARDLSKDVVEGTGKASRVTVYYTEEAGHKVAHFFKKSPDSAQ